MHFLCILPLVFDCISFVSSYRQHGSQWLCNYHFPNISDNAWYLMHNGIIGEIFFLLTNACSWNPLTDRRKCFEICEVMASQWTHNSNSNSLSEIRSQCVTRVIWPNQLFLSDGLHLSQCSKKKILFWYFYVYLVDCNLPNKGAGHSIEG